MPLRKRRKTHAVLSLCLIPPGQPSPPLSFTASEIAGLIQVVQKQLIQENALPPFGTVRTDEQQGLAELYQKLLTLFRRLAIYGPATDAFIQFCGVPTIQ